MKNEREYRTLNLEVEERNEAGDPSYIVRGYASTFEPYVLFEEEGIQYKEQIDPHAFDEADMSDVVFRVDHEGAVYARSSAGTLKVGIDERGLFDEADLSKTAKARELFEDIVAETIRSRVSLSPSVRIHMTGTPTRERFSRLRRFSMCHLCHFPQTHQQVLALQLATTSTE